GVLEMQFTEVQFEILALGRRYLDAGEHPAVVRAMVAIVKQTDVPARPDRLQKAQEGSGPFGKLEAEEHLVLDAAGMAADHVPRVLLRDLVLGHVLHGIAGAAQRTNDRILFRAPLRQRETDEDLRGVRTLIAIVEFSDTAR